MRCRISVGEDSRNFPELKDDMLTSLRGTMPRFSRWRPTTYPEIQA